MGALKLEGVEGRGDVHRMRPEALVIVTDPGEALCDARRAGIPFDEALVRSIMAQGVLKNVLCRRDGDRLLVIDGRERVKAAVEANKRLRKAGKSDGELVLVPCTIPGGGEEVAVDAMVAANMVKVDLTPAARVAYVEQLAKRGRSAEQIATVSGMPLPAVKAALALDGATKKVRAALDAGKLSVSAAAKLASKPSKEQDEKLAELLSKAPAEGKRTSRVTVREVQGGPVRPSRKEGLAMLAALRAAPSPVWLAHADLIGVLDWLLTGAPCPAKALDILAAVTPKDSRRTP